MYSTNLEITILPHEKRCCAEGKDGSFVFQCQLEKGHGGFTLEGFPAVAKHRNLINGKLHEWIS